MKFKIFIKKHKIKLSILLILLIAYYFCLPRKIFNKPYSTVIESKEQGLLGAQIATDGQWRFPELDSVPYKFKQCIIHFEDKHFYYHLGVNPVSIVKALNQNRKAGKIIRGGSTITQQTIRLAREGKARSYWEKIIETIWATRLEFRYSKENILKLYASHAPFGGNVVGLDMASWRYFGVQSSQLSWAESAVLAVLPNSPSLIYPGKNQEQLLQKRNRLLKKLLDNKVISNTDYELSIIEPLPQKPHELPQMAQHLLTSVAKKNKGEYINTTIQYDIQNRANQIIKTYYNQYHQSEIYNIAVLVVDVKTRNIISYVGNSPTTKEHQKDVDIIHAPRSTGSILKPFLYASMLDKAEILPETLIPDIPTLISGYNPKNFNSTYEGAVPANRALSRSLNIPSVLMLQNFGIYRFYEQLQKFHLRDINKHPNHYGLSIVLGGAESNIWDLCKTYAGMASTLNHYNETRKYRKEEYVELNWNKKDSIDFGKSFVQKQNLGAGAIWQTFEAMKEVNRPQGDEAWKFYDSSLEIAWKTGTSFGNRDAWAIGVNKNYVVGVWVGNASGEGRPSLVGVTTAAPILFDVFNLLPREKWFPMPYSDMEEVKICTKSGYLAQENCPAKSEWIVSNVNKTKSCPYHRLIHLDSSEKYQVNSSCEPIEYIINRSWFVLPPVIEWYYRRHHFDYEDLPAFRSDCINSAYNQFDFIYPKHGTTIYQTKNFYGELQAFVAKAAHVSKDETLFWYVDKQYIGSTSVFHEKDIKTTTGEHIISVVDTKGNEKVIKIYVNAK